MDIWTIPFIIVVIVICTICAVSVRKTERTAGILNEKNAEIPDAIEEHPFTLNPILWIILVSAIFVGLIILYYAFSYRV